MSKKFHAATRVALETVANDLYAASQGNQPLEKVVKEAETVLSKVQIVRADVENTVERIVEVLSSSNVLHCPEHDVRLPLVLSFIHIARIHTKGCPFAKPALVHFAQHLISTLKVSTSSTSATQKTVITILKAAIEADVHKLLLSLDETDLVMSLTKVLLEDLNHGNKDTKREIEPCLSLVLEELLVTSTSEWMPVVDQLFHYLLQTTKKEAATAASVFLLNFLNSHEKELQRPMGAWLSSHIAAASKGKTGKQLPIVIAQLLSKLEQPTVKMLLDQLQSLEPQGRLLAAQALLHFLGQKRSAEVNENTTLLASMLLERLKDSSAEVRALVLEGAQLLLSHVQSEAMRVTVLQELQDRIRDCSTVARSAAVRGSVKVLIARGGGLQQQDLWEEVRMRLRDTDMAVRKNTIKSMLRLFQQTCRRIAEGAVLDEVDKLALPIPAQVIHDSVGEAELRMGLLDGTLLSGGTLLPADLPASSVVDIWVQVHGASPDNHWESVLRLLSISCRFLTDVLLYSHLMSKPKPTPKKGSKEASKEGSKEADRHQRQIQTLQRDIIHHMAMDMSKTTQRLEQLASLQHQGIFAAILQASNPFVTAEEREASMLQLKQLLQQQGTDSTVYQLLAAMVLRSSPRFLVPAHMQAMIDIAQGPKHNTITAILASFGKAIPVMLLGQSDVIVQLTTESTGKQQELYSKLMAAIAPVYKRLQPAIGSPHMPTVSKALLKSLRKLCKDGPPAAGKASVLALHGFNSDVVAEKELTSLLQELMAVVDRGSEVSPTVLLSVSKIAQLVPGAFSPHLTKFVFSVIRQHLQPFIEEAVQDEGMVNAVWGSPADPARDAAIAIKSVVNAVTPDARISMDAAASDMYVPAVEMVFTELTRVLETLADASEDHRSADLAWIRLTAGSRMLRLIRRYDRLLGPTQYAELSLLIQDVRVEVRQHFAAKLMKFVNHLLQIGTVGQQLTKYVAMLALASADPAAANQATAYRYLKEFTVKCRAIAHQKGVAAAKVPAGANTGGTTLALYPEFLVPYLIFILAHHPDCPPAGSPADQYLPFVKMLQFGLAPLLTTPCNYGSANCLGAIIKMLRSIKQTVDATDVGLSDSVYELCDVAVCAAKDIAAEVASGKEAKIIDYVGPVPLPRSLYDPTPQPDGAARKRDGSHLPAGLTIPRFIDPTAPAPKGKTAAGTANGKTTAKKRRTAAAPKAARAKKKAAVQIVAKPLRAGGRAAAAAARAAMAKAKPDSDEDEDSPTDESQESSSDEESEGTAPAPSKRVQVQPGQGGKPAAATPLGKHQVGAVSGRSPAKQHKGGATAGRKRTATEEPVPVERARSQSNKRKQDDQPMFKPSEYPSVVLPEEEEQPTGTPAAGHREEAAAEGEMDSSTQEEDALASPVPKSGGTPGRSKDRTSALKAAVRAKLHTPSASEHTAAVAASADKAKARSTSKSRPGLRSTDRRRQDAGTNACVGTGAQAGLELAASPSGENGTVTTNGKGKRQLTKPDTPKAKRTKNGAAQGAVAAGDRPGRSAAVEEVDRARSRPLMNGGKQTAVKERTMPGAKDGNIGKRAASKNAGAGEDKGRKGRQKGVDLRASTGGDDSGAEAALPHLAEASNGVASPKGKNPRKQEKKPRPGGGKDGYTGGCIDAAKEDDEPEKPSVGKDTRKARKGKQPVGQVDLRASLGGDDSDDEAGTGSPEKALAGADTSAQVTKAKQRARESKQSKTPDNLARTSTKKAVAGDKKTRTGDKNPAAEGKKAAAEQEEGKAETGVTTRSSGRGRAAEGSDGPSTSEKAGSKRKAAVQGSKQEGGAAEPKAAALKKKQRKANSLIASEE